MQREGERVRKECEMRRRGRGRRCWRRVRVQRGQVVFVCVGWGRKWVRLVFLFMALMPAVRRGAARLLPLQGIARGGGRVRNRAESSDGKERGLFWVSGGHWTLVWPSIGAVQTRRRSIRCPWRSVATGSAIYPGRDDPVPSCSCRRDAETAYAIRVGGLRQNPEPPKWL